MTAAGPIPRSWAAATATTGPTVNKASEYDEPAWRSKALSLFFFARCDDIASTAAVGVGAGAEGSHLTRNRCPSLVECCLRVLLEQYCASEDEAGDDVSILEELASVLPSHHRKEVVRMCAVWCPLSGARLRALLGVGRIHVEGELVVVQPASPLRQEMFRTQTTHGAHIRVQHQHRYQQESGSEKPWQRADDDVEEADPDHSGSTVTVTDATRTDWQEQETEQEQESFTAVGIVSTTLSIPVLLALPCSLTRLALVHLSAPIPIHRLPDKCPLLELLDVSYNPWLAQPAWGRERALERVEWGRWAYLKVLGCRDCGVTLEELREVNEGRWEDVRIVVT